MEILSGGAAVSMKTENALEYIPEAGALSPDQIRLGIGITTYNRKAILANTLDHVVRLTRSKVDLIVADDGSEDGTIEMLREGKYPYVTGENRGIAWNKNRALFYLYNMRLCDVIIMLEDDTFPMAEGWELPWIEAATRWGHINLAGHWFANHFKEGAGTVGNPVRADVISGQCVSFTRLALDKVGFLDTRFGKYGFEHAEHTERMVRAGFGGNIDPEHSGKYVYYLLNSDLEVGCLTQQVDEDSIARNAQVYAEIRSEGIFRQAWRSHEEFNILRSELLASSRCLVPAFGRTILR